MSSIICFFLNVELAFHRKGEKKKGNTVSKCLRMLPNISDHSRKIQLQQTITYDLIKVIENNLSAHHCSLTKHSAIMGISPKKLQRLLRDEGTSFSQVLEKFRACKAFHLLHETNLPIKTIAINLGYSSSESFNTACKRWFQKSPRQMRQGES